MLYMKPSVNMMPPVETYPSLLSPHLPLLHWIKGHQTLSLMETVCDPGAGGDDFFASWRAILDKLDKPFHSLVHLHLQNKLG